MKYYKEKHIYKYGLLKPVSSVSEYNIYHGIKQRCYNKNNKYYSYYGGRGICMSCSWLNSFEKFYKDMGPRPSKNYSIDRIDNSKGYFKENCRWSTKTEQQINRRQTVAAIEQIKLAKSFSLKSFHKKYGNPLTRTKKICSRCMVTKQLDEFSKNKLSVDKHASYCKPCFKIMKRKYK